MLFPQGDTLGVVFSFLSTFNLLHGALFIVCKEWNRVLCELPHAWGETLNLTWMDCDIPHSRFAWHRIEELNLSCCEKVTDASLARISSLSLQHLSLDFCDQITDVGLASLSSLPLQHLNLCHCWRITDAGLVHLSSMPLYYLNLVRCKYVTGVGLEHICSPELRYLLL